MIHFFILLVGGGGVVSKQNIEPRMIVTFSYFCFDIMTDSILKSAFLNGVFFYTLRIHIFAIIQDIACRLIYIFNKFIGC